MRRKLFLLHIKKQLNITLNFIFIHIFHPNYINKCLQTICGFRNFIHISVGQEITK